MTRKTYSDLIKQALLYGDGQEHLFISLASTGEHFPPDNIDENAATCRLIWQDAHTTIRDMRSLAGLTQKALADRFGIPHRTIQNWESDSGSGRECPAYVRMMLLELLGQSRIQKED